MMGSVVADSPKGVRRVVRRARNEARRVCDVNLCRETGERARILQKGLALLLAEIRREYGVKQVSKAIIDVSGANENGASVRFGCQANE